MDASVVGRLLLVVGGVCLAVGAFLALGGRLPFGRLPGDISVQGSGGGFAFPLVSCIVVSVLATIVLNIVLRR